MAESITYKKAEQESYLRQVQQEKTQKKRELMAQQQQDIAEARQRFQEANSQLDQDSADAIVQIKDETKQMIEQDRSERDQRAQDIRTTQQEQRQAMREANGSVSESSAEKKTVYNRQGQKKPMIQNYETKETDNFYRVQNRGSRISENNNGYVIEAYAPEHEKDNLKVSIQKNKAVVSGHRKFGDVAQDGSKKMHTNNFQTFREEFKLSRPVSHEGMTRERVGDYVRFTIPKLEAIRQPDEET